MADDEDIPDFMKELSKGDFKRPDDGFGPEDIVWAGQKGDLDPDELIAKHGQDPYNQLQLLVMALVRGHTPTARSQDILSRTQTAMTAITGEKPRRGKIEVDYHSLLQEVAWRYFAAFYEGNLNDADVALLPIVRVVLSEDAARIAAEHGIEVANLERILVRKFEAKKDLYLSRATLDDDWDRVRSFSELKKAAELLAKAGIPIDQTGLKPTRLAKNHTK